MNLDNLHLLSSGAARLALVYTFHGGNLPKKELMRRAGLNDTSSLYRCRKEIADRLDTTVEELPTLRLSSTVCSNTTNLDLTQIRLDLTTLLSRSNLVSILKGSLGADIAPIGAEVALPPSRTDADIAPFSAALAPSADIALNSAALTSIHNGYSAEVAPFSAALTSIRDGSSVGSADIAPFSAKAASVHNGYSQSSAESASNSAALTSIRDGSSQGSADIASTDAEVTLLDKLEAADEMDGGGVPTSTKSPFYLRRQAQMRLLREAWAAVFPDQHPLTTDAMKQMLGVTENHAAFIIATAKDIKADMATKKKVLGSPLGYIQKALPDIYKRDKASLTSPIVPVPGVDLSTVAQRERDQMITKDELRPVSAEELAEMRAFSARYANPKPVERYKLPSR